MEIDEGDIVIVLKSTRGRLPISTTGAYVKSEKELQRVGFIRYLLLRADLRHPDAELVVEIPKEINFKTDRERLDKNISQLKKLGCKVERI